MHRITTVTALILSLSLVGVSDLQAQRRGFIIGLGVGPGLNTLTDGGGSETDVGVATDFKIGAQVSPTIQVYYLGRSNWFEPEVSNLVAAGISALGVTYVLPSAPVHLSGGIGFATFLEFDFFGDSFTGFGLTGGFGYEFAELWLFDIAVTYGRFDERDINMFQARAGISILSH